MPGNLWSAWSIKGARGSGGRQRKVAGASLGPPNLVALLCHSS